MTVLAAPALPRLGDDVERFALLLGTPREFEGGAGCVIRTYRSDLSM